MRKLEQLGERKLYQSKQRRTRRAEWKIVQWEKMLRKSTGVMENDVTSTAEETLGDDEKIGGRDTV